ncbi:MAG: efflux transporter outer membrane subunit [Sphingopyxis sp.]
MILTSTLKRAAASAHRLRAALPRFAPACLPARLPAALAGGVAMAALSACATVPVLAPAPALRDPASLGIAATMGAHDGAFPVDQWWVAMGDPALNALMDRALAQSPNLAAAAARLMAAQAQLALANGADGPTIIVDGSISGARQSQNQGFPPGLIPGTVRSQGRVGGSISFDPDIWGRNRAALAAATSDASAGAVDAAQARLMLTAAIGSAYADLAGLWREHDVASEMLTNAQQALVLAQRRQRAGLDNASTTQAAAARVAEGQGAVAAVDQAIALTCNALAALAGDGPDRGAALARPILPPGAELALPVDLPMNLIGRRPDIVSARLRAQAAAARMGVARADYFPSINLSATGGLQAIGLVDLVQPGSIFASFGPAVRLPLFAQNTLDARYQSARAGYDLAVANYNDTLVAAVRDVADAVARKRANSAQTSAAQRALAATQAAQDVADLRFRHGLISAVQRLSAQQARLVAQHNLVVLQRDGARADIAIIRSLGGGFADGAAQLPPSAPGATTTNASSSPSTGAPAASTKAHSFHD